MQSTSDNNRNQKSKQETAILLTLLGVDVSWTTTTQLNFQQWCDIPINSL